ncbi:MAG: hypothetical protein WCI03_05320 [bacterium]
MNNTTAQQDGRGRVLRTAEQRQELMAGYKSSGLGMTAFCRREGVSLSTFSHWLNPRVKVKRSRSIRPEKPPMKFTEVKMALGGAAPIEVELPGGARIRIRDDEAWLVVGQWLREVTGC